MKIHEYQAKEILRKFNVAVPNGSVAFSGDEAVKIAGNDLGGNAWVVKAQIHAGGRGKGGGVKVAKDAAEFDTFANEILGMTLVTKQTGPEGKLVKKLLIEQGLNIAKELYENMGFKEVGKVPKGIYKDGKYIDLVRMALELW